MKSVIVGGTGRIGSKLAGLLGPCGNEVLQAARARV
jgi:predicted dinucleotide-binding enzyme